jgi:hypothetical protein
MLANLIISGLCLLLLLRSLCKAWQQASGLSFGRPDLRRRPSKVR